jgi:hypothetical protein
MSCVVSVPRDLLFLVANYLLPKDQQNKLVFRYSHDWRNFINTNQEYFSEWKKQTQVIVLDSEYAVRFIRLPEFSDRIRQQMEDSMQQLELQIQRCELEEQELRSIPSVKRLSASHCTLRGFP